MRIQQLVKSTQLGWWVNWWVGFLVGEAREEEEEDTCKRERGRPWPVSESIIAAATFEHAVSKKAISFLGRFGISLHLPCLLPPHPDLVQRRLLHSDLVQCFPHPHLVLCLFHPYLVQMFLHSYPFQPPSFSHPDLVKSFLHADLIQSFLHSHLVQLSLSHPDIDVLHLVSFLRDDVNLCLGAVS